MSIRVKMFVQSYLSTKVEIGYVYQRPCPAIPNAYLQKQKLDMSIRETITNKTMKSTKVEIGYVYQRAGLALTGAKDAINR